jgi:hypothetical protein
MWRGEITSLNFATDNPGVTSCEAWSAHGGADRGGWAWGPRNVRQRGAPINPLVRCLIDMITAQPPRISTCQVRLGKGEAIQRAPPGAGQSKEDRTEACWRSASLLVTLHRHSYLHKVHQNKLQSYHNAKMDEDDIDLRSTEVGQIVGIRWEIT